MSALLASVIDLHLGDLPTCWLCKHGWACAFALQRKIELVSRLFGNVVGFLDAPDKSLTAFRQVRNLQRQVCLLCPHATRTHEDIVLLVRQTWRMSTTWTKFRRVVPTSWADCNVSNLWVVNTCFDFAFNNLDKVEELSFLDENRFYHYATIFPTAKHYAVDALRGCPNLKKLRIDGALTRRTATQLVKTLASMPKLKAFVFEGPAPTSLLNDLQAIPSLSSVQVHIYAERLDDGAAIVASAMIAWVGLLWLDLAWFRWTDGVAWLVLVGLGLAWLGSVWLGLVWLGWIRGWISWVRPLNMES